MRYNVPPDEQELFQTLYRVPTRGDGRDGDKLTASGGGGDSNMKSTTEVLSGLIRGLISPANAQGFYTAYATLLKVDTGKLTVAEITKIIDSTLSDASSGSDASKREKTLLARARVLALGGLVRSGKLQQPSELSSVLKELVTYCERKESLSALATPFIISLLESVPGNTKVSLAPIEDLLAKKLKNSTPQLQIALKAHNLKLELNYDYLEEMDNVISTLLMYVQADNADTLQSLFKYLTDENKLAPFWTALTSRLRRTHLSLLIACLETAILQKCPGSLLLSREIIVYLLESFRKLNTQDHQKAKEGFALLLNWAPSADVGTDEEDSPVKKQPNKTKTVQIQMTRKERKHAIKNMFEGVPNLLHEYKFLKPNLQQLLNVLTTKEIDEVLKGVESNNTGATGDRLRICCQNVRCLIAGCKSVSLSSKAKIMEEVFKAGFCRKNDEVEPAEKDTETEPEITETHTKTAFTSLLGLALENELLDQLFAVVHGIVVGQDEEWSLASPVGGETRKLWKKGAKLTKTSSGASGAAKNCLKLHLIADLIQTEPGTVKANDAIEVLMEICEGGGDDAHAEGQDEDENPNQRLAEFILEALMQEDNTVINYEPMLKALFQDQTIIAKHLGLITDILDPEDEEDEEEGMDEGDDDNEDSDEEEENDDDNEEEDDLSDSDLEYDVEDEDSTAAANAKKQLLSSIATNGKGKIVEGSDSDSESSIDMDEATEEDLQRMDAALAKVFSTKKRVKNSAELEKKRFMRACRLLELVLKTVRVPDAALVPLILMPSLACLLKCSKQIGASSDKCGRLVRLLGKVTSLKEVREPEAVDEEILNGMVEDIQKYCKGKLEKRVRETLVSALKMLAKCFKLEIDLEKPNLRRNRRIQVRSKKGKKNQGQKIPVAVIAPFNDSKPNPKANAAAGKKRRQSAPAPTQTLVTTNGVSVSKGKPTPTPPAAKKKRKSTAT